MGTNTAIVVPCYNEADRFRSQAFVDYLARDNGTTFYLVDDGSTDRTGELHQQLQDRFPDRIVASSIAHGGKSAAVRQGVLAAFQSNAVYIGYWDADLSTPLECIETLSATLDRRNDISCVFGSRVALLGRDIRRNLWRHYPGRVFATMVSMMLKLGIYDTQCGAKLFRASAPVGELFQQPFVTRWCFDVELIARMKQQGILNPRTAIVEHPLEQWHDVPGSRISPFSLPGIVAELWLIYWKYLRTGRDSHGG